MASTSASINALMFTTGPSDYYTDAFRQVLEDHMWYLRGITSTQPQTVSPQEAWQNEGDLYGFLAGKLNIEPQYHWVVMRLNNFTSPTQFGKHVNQLLIPSFTLIEQLRSAFNTASTISS